MTECCPAPHATRNFPKFCQTSVRRYYEGQLRSDDEMLPCATRNVCLRLQPDGRPGTAAPDLKCSGHMHPVVTEAALYTQVCGQVLFVAVKLVGCVGGWVGT